MIRRRPLRLHPHVVGFDLELRQRFGDAVAGGCRVLERVPQGGRRVDRGKYLAARRLDVGLEALDLAQGRFRGQRLRLERLRRTIAIGGRRPGTFTPLRDRGARRLAAGLQGAQLRGHRLRPHAQRVDLLRVERDLLLAAVDVQLARVRRFARGRRTGFRFGELDAKAPEIGLDFGEPRGCHRLALARVAEPRPRRLDDLRQLAILPREQHFLQPPKLVPELLVSTRLRRLPLERPALLVHLEDDVVDPGEVLLRRFELQLRGAPPGLVLRDAGRFLNQLTAIGRPRAEDQADLALLDDGVRLRAEAGVHQQFVHVPQPADLAVDQVLALTRSIQPPRDLDFPGDRLDHFICGRGRCRFHCRCGDRCHHRSRAVLRRAPLARRSTEGGLRRRPSVSARRCR